jgi:ComF family protein
LCRRCGVRLEADSFYARPDAAGSVCEECEADEPAFAGVIAYGEYRDELRELIHLLKYERMASVAGLLGEKLAGAIAEREKELTRPMLVTAVPLFRQKRRERGANQAEQIARVVTRRLRGRGWSLDEDYKLLERRRATRSQSELNHKQRRANLRGVFALSQGSTGIEGRNILLVDDIVTTSTTARECAKVLRKAGAAEVWVAVVGRAQWDETAEWDPSGIVMREAGAVRTGAAATGKQATGAEVQQPTAG